MSENVSLTLNTAAAVIIAAIMIAAPTAATTAEKELPAISNFFLSCDCICFFLSAFGRLPSGCMFTSAERYISLCATFSRTRLYSLARYNSSHSYRSLDLNTSIIPSCFLNNNIEFTGMSIRFLFFLFPFVDLKESPKKQLSKGCRKIFTG